MSHVLEHSDRLADGDLDEMRTELRRLVEVVGYLPHRQPLAVVTGDDTLAAVNQPLLDLLGAEGPELVGADWEDYLPEWDAHVRGAEAAANAAPRTCAFESRLVPRRGEPLAVHVVARPVPDEPTDDSPLVWAVFVTADDADDVLANDDSPPVVDRLDDEPCSCAKATRRHRLGLQAMLAALTERFVNATLEDTAVAVDFALCEMGLRMGAECVALRVVGPDSVSVPKGRIWRRRDGGVADERVGMRLDEMPRLRERISGRRPFVVDVAPEDLTEETGAERGFLREVSVGDGSVAIAPVVHQSTLIAVLLLGSAAGARWGDDDLSFLRMVADQVSGLLVAAWDEENLHTVSDALADLGADEAENLTRICRAAGEVTGAGFVVYRRRRGGRLVRVSGWNVPAGLPESEPAEDLSAELMTGIDDRVHVVDDLGGTVFARTDPSIRRYGLRTLAGLSVRASDGAVAVLTAFFTADVALRRSQIELLQMLGRAAATEEDRRFVIRDHMFHLAQIEQAMERTIGTLSGAMGARDPYTAGHERRVAHLAEAIAGELGLNEDERRLLRLAATIHDIGKMTVPVVILTKPGRLSEQEFALIRQHSQVGHELLGPAGLPREITDAVLQHHERLDGSGYPSAASGEEIGIFARILAVADVTEAMSSDRPYRPSLGIEAALAEIEDGRGLRYDARAVDACLRLFRKKGFRLKD